MKADRERFQVYVRIDKEITDKVLVAAFRASYPSFKTAIRMLGYAWIVFSSEEGVTKALQSKRIIINGKTCEIKPDNKNAVAEHKKEESEASSVESAESDCSTRCLNCKKKFLNLESLQLHEESCRKDVNRGEEKSEKDSWNCKRCGDQRKAHHSGCKCGFPKVCRYCGKEHSTGILCNCGGLNPPKLKNPSVSKGPTGEWKMKAKENPPNCNKCGSPICQEQSNSCGCDRPSIEDEKNTANYCRHCGKHRCTCETLRLTDDHPKKETEPQIEQISENRDGKRALEGPKKPQDSLIQSNPRVEAPTQRLPQQIEDEKMTFLSRFMSKFE
eukprot:TRINITY_DN1152_c0_g4_i1.p1 TRINITY_DN1152_c0_g4~~TRINITY_DN1152_c0_g4_i1.p1  ORF type:complete len:329 (+),score=58.08 TRINITY_DN1152_c0_g4_i1:474-1460(+)